MWECQNRPAKGFKNILENRACIESETHSRCFWAPFSWSKNNLATIGQNKKPFWGLHFTMNTNHSPTSKCLIVFNIQAFEIERNGGPGGMGRWRKKVKKCRFFNEKVNGSKNVSTLPRTRSPGQNKDHCLVESISKKNHQEFLRYGKDRNSHTYGF